MWHLIIFPPLPKRYLRSTHRRWVCLGLLAQAGAPLAAPPRTTCLPQTGVAVSADVVVSAGGWTDTTVKVWSIATRECLATLIGHTRGVFSVALPSPGIAVSGGGDGAVKVWSLSSYTCIATHHRGRRHIKREAKRTSDTDQSVHVRACHAIQPSRRRASL